MLIEHDTHIRDTEGCETCHHDLFSSDSRNACSDCHGDDVAAEDFTHEDLKDIEGHSCESCHQTIEGVEPRSCRWCHPDTQESDERIIACSSCHDDEYTPDILTHDEMQEVDGHECESCHNISAVSGAYHEQCNRCHFMENPDEFRSVDGSAMCERCHLK